MATGSNFVVVVVVVVGICSGVVVDVKAAVSILPGLNPGGEYCQEAS